MAEVWFGADCRAGFHESPVSTDDAYARLRGFATEFDWAGNIVAR
jgi:hypothetical protein